MRNADDVLGRRQQLAESPQDSPTGLEGPVFGERHDFRTTALPSDQQPATRKTVDSDPYAKPFKLSRVYEIAPVGAAGAAQYNAVAGEGNGRFTEQLDFEARSFAIDNWSNQYVYVSAARRWILPLQVNVILAIPGGTSALDIKFIAPPAKAQPAPGGNTFVIIQAFEALLMPTNGIVTT